MTSYNLSSSNNESHQKMKARSLDDCKDPMNSNQPLPMPFFYDWQTLLHLQNALPKGIEQKTEILSLHL